jgi:glutathione S-transferase
MIGSGVIWVDARHNLLSDFPSLDAYAKRMLARPSFQRAFAAPA